MGDLVQNISTRSILNDNDHSGRERISGYYLVKQKPNPQPDQDMPFYEYVCRKCRERFGEVLTIKEHETKEPRCPKCQSTDLEKVIEPFFAKTASKTRGY